MADLKNFDSPAQQRAAEKAGAHLMAVANSWGERMGTVAQKI
jgi:uncharacterized protein YoaH (UPF0181 family)